MARDTFDLIFLDVRLPDGEGTELLLELQSQPQKPLVVIVTGFGSVESAVECMRNGAFDYMLKPFSSDQLQVTLKKAENFNQLLKVNAYFSHAEEDEAGYELLGKSPAMEQSAPIDPQGRPHPGHRPDRRAKAAPARNWSPARSTAKAPAPTPRSSRSIAPPSRRT